MKTLRKPDDWDDTPSFTPEEIALGGHHMRIKHFRATQSKSGNDMIILALDTAENDKQPGYWDQYGHRLHLRTYPYGGRFYVTIYSPDGYTNPRFKSMIRCIEESNPGFEIDWEQDIEPQMKGRKVGAVYGAVTKDGTTYREIRWLCSDQGVDTQPVPKPITKGDLKI